MSRAHWARFVALCLLSASAWLAQEAWPSQLPAAERQCLHDLILALVVCPFGWRRFARSRSGARPWWRLAVAGVCLLGLPAMLVDSTRSAVPQATAAALFALLPVVVVLLVSNIDLGRAVQAGAGSLLVPALLGLAGVLLLLSFALPDSPRQAGLEAIIVLAAAIAGAASVWMYRLLPEFTVAEAVALCSLANALFLAIWFLATSFGPDKPTPAWAGPWNWSAFAAEAALSLLFDLPQLALLLWLMRDVIPTRLAARAFVIPLLTILEGYLLLRPEPTARSLAGAALALFGSWRLMANHPRPEEPLLVLR